MAREILLEEGYDALTPARIAERMDITDAGVHYHFETTDDLVVGVVEYLQDEYTERIDRREGPPDRRLAAILRERFEVAETLRELTAPPSFQLITAAAAGDDDLREALVGVVETNVEGVAAVLRDGARSGVFELEDPERAARLLVSAVDAAAVRAALDMPTVPLAEGVREHVLADIYVGEPPSIAPDAAEVDG